MIEFFSKYKIFFMFLWFLSLSAFPVMAEVSEEDKEQFKRPAEIPFPATNPYSPEKVALGKSLFFDPRLSANNNINCASCHNPSFGWEDGQPFATGTEAKPGKRNAPTVLNRAWGGEMFWDGRAEDLERQALGPIQDPLEMNMSLDDLVVKLSEIEGYKKQFAQVFPKDGLTKMNIAKAIATYERTIVSGVSSFDRWIKGDESAISTSAKNGFELFIGKANCADCHSGWNFSDENFHDIGVDTTDLGRQSVTNDTSNQHGFKTPGLRNINQRAPYMHNGSMDTLEEVVNHYVSGGEKRTSLSPMMKPLELTQQEISDLIAFMNTLTGEDRPVTLPILPY